VPICCSVWHRVAKAVTSYFAVNYLVLIVAMPDDSVVVNCIMLFVLIVFSVYVK
jgi:hypothetical protein